jgi:hypothetical protein
VTRPAHPLLLVVAGIALAGCATRGGASSAPGDVDPKLRLSSYIEEGQLMALVVSTRAALVRDSKPYWPIEVAVVNKGLERLTVTRESFTIVTADGKRYPAAGRDELARSYGNTDLDRRFSEAAEAVAARFSTFSPVLSNFTPGFAAGIARDNVQLPRFSYLVDFLYFPRPEDAAAAQPLELHLAAPELEDPVFVRFRIGGGAK